MSTQLIPGQADWSKQKPTAPGAYFVRGFRIGEPDSRPALVEVDRNNNGELCCNLHEFNSRDEVGQWEVLEVFSDDFEWLGPLQAGGAYQGAREDVAIWKRHCLEAEARVRQLEQIIDQMGEDLNAINGPTLMGEPVIPQEPRAEAAAECTNEDSWNCKYCRKTETCAALNGQRNFAGATAPQPPEQQEPSLHQGTGKLIADVRWSSGSSMLGGTITTESWARIVGIVMGRQEHHHQSVPDALFNTLRKSFPLLSDEGLDEELDHCEWSIQQERKRLHAILDAATSAPGTGTEAARDVLAERQRQVSAEGMTHAGDDGYRAAELPRAAAAYILNGANDEAPAIWPWAKAWWKPRDARANYVRAGALILAEIERLDRAAAREQESGQV